jgi:hypothetical protein
MSRPTIDKKKISRPTMAACDEISNPHGRFICKKIHKFGIQGDIRDADAIYLITRSYPGAFYRIIGRDNQIVFMRSSNNYVFMRSSNKQVIKVFIPAGVIELIK